MVDAARPGADAVNWETGLLWGAFSLLGAALLVDLAPVVRGESRARLSYRLLGLGVGLLGVALVLLVAYFLVARVSVEYVFTYTRRTYPWPYRLAGLWGGQKGTLLLWTTLTGLFGLFLLRRGESGIRRGTMPRDATETLSAFRRAWLVVLLLLTGATLVARVFSPTPDYLLQFRPHGNGLQPVLLTPFMLIHPPIQFAAYALAGLLFAGGVAAVATGRRAWADLVQPWARLAWLLLTLGLGLGGLWAYYVLNFGGFWAWDPVETANLIAWFPVTLLLHTLLRYREGRFPALAPFFALATLPLVLFSAVATRTGLWVSVHAFTDPSKNFARDPLVRLLNILGTSDLLQYLAALVLVCLLFATYAVLLGRSNRIATSRRPAACAALTAALSAAVALLLLDPIGAYGMLFQAAHVLSLGRSAPIGLLIILVGAAAAVLLTSPSAPPTTERSRGPRRDWGRWLTERRLLTLGVLLLSVAFLVVLFLELLSVNGLPRQVYDDRAPLLALPVLATLATLFLLPWAGPRRAAAVGVLAITAGLVLALALPAHWEVLLVLPALAAAGVASAVRALQYAGAGAHASVRDRAAALLLVVGALAAYLYWGNPPTRIDLGFATVRPAWAWSVPAYAATTLAFAAGALHLGRPQPRFARAGALALLPTYAFGLATLAAVAALALLAGSRSPSSGLGRAFRERRAPLRKSSRYLTHVALVLGLTGYALATYEAQTSDTIPVDAAGSPAFGGYSFQLLSSGATDLDETQRLPREIHARILMLRDGSPVDEAEAVYWLVPDDKPGHYDARVSVLRLPTRDVYLYPSSFRTPEALLTDHVNGVRPTDPAVDRVELTVKVLPGMSLVWAGLWLLALAMTANLALGARPSEPAADAQPLAETPSAPSRPAPDMPRGPLPGPATSEAVRTAK